MRKITKLGAMMLALMLVFSMSITALADNAAIIDPDQKGSITIHKYDNTGTVVGDNADGTELQDTSALGNPLNGITFKITYLANATVATTVSDALDMVDAMDNAGTLAANQQSGTTGFGSNAAGVYAFTNLTQGVYLVEEVENNAVSSTISPFLISIPMTNPTDNASWLYDVHVYPKNTVTTDATIDKKLVDESGKEMDRLTADVGDEVTWAINVSIPANVAGIDATNATQGYFFVTDSLDSRLSYKSVVVEILGSDGTVKEVLTGGTHYLLTAPTVGTPGTNNDDIVVDFKTVDGIAKLAAADLGDYIRITVRTTINESAIENLATGISNSADLYFDNENGDPTDITEPPVTPPVTPGVDLSGLSVFKYSVDDELDHQALNGAEFTIYATETDAQNGMAIQVGDADWSETSGSSNLTGAATAVYKDGYLYFSGAALESALGEVLTAGQTFYLVETKSPDGYKLLNSIIPISLGNTVEVENTQTSPGFTLPITGGSGTVLFTIVGILLIGGAILLAVIAKRKGKASIK